MMSARTPGDALRLLGVVFQSRTLDLDLSVLQNLIYHAALHGIGRRAAHAARRASAGTDRARRIARTTRCAIFPAGRCAASRSPARCCIGRACSCSTSRPSASTSSRAPTFSPTMRRLVAREGHQRALGDASDRRGRRQTTTSSCCIKAACWRTGRSQRGRRTPARTDIRQRLRTADQDQHGRRADEAA